MQVVIVIPARYGSTRLPGKPLMDILGKPMVLHVVDRARAVRSAQRMVVATDDERIAQVVREYGAEALMTSPEHATGTDRLVEVTASVPGDLYVNLQGDEPLVRPEDIEKLITGMLADESVAVGTLCHPISAREARNPDIVKVVLAKNGNALYFSRAPIPFPRDAAEEARYYKHVGVYAYRRYVLDHYGRLQQPMLERSEKLEQLRLLHAGFRIRAFEVDPTGPGVDRPEGLEQVRALMAGKPLPKTASLADVRLVITDVDGVLTDGGLYYNDSGEVLQRFHVRDGLGMKRLEACGIRVAVVSGRGSPALGKRVEELGVSLVRTNATDKASACRDIMQDAGITPMQTACIGDDIPDLSAFETCGISFAVADAPEAVRRAATFTLTRKGGDGAFREAADRILSAAGQETLSIGPDGSGKAKTAESGKLRIIKEAVRSRNNNI